MKYANAQKEINMRTQAKQNLFGVAWNQGYWGLELVILSYSPVANEDRGKLISKIWTRFVDEQLWNELLSVAAQRIEYALRDIDPGNDVMDPRIVMPILEEHKFQKDGAELWAVQTMIKARLGKTEALHAYLDALQNHELPLQIRCEFSYCAAYLVREGAELRNRSVKEMKEFFIKNAKQFRYYDDAFKLINKL